MGDSHPACQSVIQGFFQIRGQTGEVEDRHFRLAERDALVSGEDEPAQMAGSGTVAFADAARAIAKPTR